MKNLLLKDLLFLAYDKSLESDPQAMRLAWSKVMDENCLPTQPWGSMTTIERDECLYLALKASGADAQQRKTLTSLLENRLWIPELASDRLSVTGEAKTTSLSPAVQTIEPVRQEPVTPAPQSGVMQAQPDSKPAPTLTTPPIPAAAKRLGGPNDPATVPLGTLPQAPALIIPVERTTAPASPVVSPAVQVPDPVFQQSECDFVLGRSFVIGSITMQGPGSEQIGYRLLYETNSESFSIIEKRGDLQRLFECPPSKFIKDAVLSVELRDSYGHSSSLGVGRLTGNEISFLIDDPENGKIGFSCTLDRNAPYFSHLNTPLPVKQAHQFKTPSRPIQVQQRHPVKQATKAPIRRVEEPDPEFTEEDYARLRGDIPMEAGQRYR